MELVSTCQESFNTLWQSLFCPLNSGQVSEVAGDKIDFARKCRICADRSLQVPIGAMHTTTRCT